MMCEATQVKVVDYSGAQVECPAILANYLASRCPRGLVAHECECGAHCWALPWDDAMANWVSHQVSPIRRIIEEKGIKPEMPALFSQHVVLVSPDDAEVLKIGRWRVFPTRARSRAKFQLQRGPRGLPLQRMILNGAKVVRFLNRDGLDCRRENLKRMNLQQLARETTEKMKRAKKARTSVQESKTTAKEDAADQCPSANSKAA